MRDFFTYIALLWAYYLCFDLIVGLLYCWLVFLYLVFVLFGYLLLFNVWWLFGCCLVDFAMVLFWFVVCLVWVCCFDVAWFVYLRLFSWLLFGIWCWFIRLVCYVVWLSDEFHEYWWFVCLWLVFWVCFVLGWLLLWCWYCLVGCCLWFWMYGICSDAC